MAHVLPSGVPYPNAAAVTPHDTNTLAHDAAALYVGVAGDVKVTTTGGDTVTFKAAPVGILYVRAKIVFSIGTTATNILALY
jgi:hypothetical protein